MKRTLLSSLVLGPALVLAALLVPGIAAAAGPITSSACTDADGGSNVSGTAVACNLWAKVQTGGPAIPGTTVTTWWGFSDTAGGPPTLPGPVLLADQGDTVTVILHNQLAVPTSIAFGGQWEDGGHALVPDQGVNGRVSTADAGGLILSDATATFLADGVSPGDLVRNTTDGSTGTVATVDSETQLTLTGALAGGTDNRFDAADAYDVRLATITYSFTASDPGTYLYEAGLIPGSQYQVSMGLHGALVVRPTGAPGQAYAGASTAFDDEALVVVSEIDPALNASATPWTVDLRAFAPKYFLVNGAAYTSTPVICAAPSICTASGNTLLLRYANAGIQHHFIAALGLHQRVLAADGSELPYPRTMVAETIAPGQSADVLVTMPATAAASTRYALYDASLAMNNSSASGIGGMLAFIDASGTAGGDTVGPLTTGVTLTETPSGSGLYTVTATTDDTTTGGATIAGAEYRVDSTSNPQTAMAASDSAFDAVSEGVTSAPATINTTGWSGTHTIYVRGRDSVGTGNWGAYASVSITFDRTGPTTSALTLIPNPSNGTVPVTLSGTASDAATGNNNVTAAEYFIGAPGATGTGTAMARNTTATIVSLSATILPGGPIGGTVTTADPAGVVLTDSSATFLADGVVPGLRVINTTDGSSGTLLSIASETQLTLAAPLTGGTANAFGLADAYTIRIQSGVVSVHARDAAGNWGPFAPITLTVDATGPATTGVIAFPNPNNGQLGQSSGNPSVRVSASFSDTAAGNSPIAAAEGFIDTVGANGAGFPFVATDGVFNVVTESGYADIPLTTINQLGTGNHTIYVHGKDAVGNWGAMSTTTLVIERTPPTIVSIDRVDPTPTTAASVAFLVTFSESVTGVASANFALVSGNGLTGAVITSVAGTGATRTVTATTGSGGGTLGLNLTSATGIRDIAGNALPTTGLPFVGQVYAVAPVYFSTAGNTNPPGVTGAADDADIYSWDGSAFSRAIDVTAITNPVPGGANVDGFDRIDATHFYLSFNGNVTLPGLGTVQDEDVVFYSAGTWSVYFDGTPAARGLSGSDLDAISIVGSTLYFSTDNTTVPAGVAGGGDDADIYSWNGTSFARVYDASALGWSSANVDGFVRVDATHFYVSYSADTTVPGLGAVQDEDVIYHNNGAWSVYFDGTSKGLTSANLDVDAFDLP